MRTFESIREFIVPDYVCDETDQLLRAAGVDGNEHFVLWSGIVDRESFRIKTVHNPDQTAKRAVGGLSVHVEGEALDRLNRWLYENEERLAVQVHTHPTRAFHSDTDDTYAMVTTLGGLSLVVPDFCTYGIRGPDTALYRLTSFGWQYVTQEDSKRILRLAE